VLDVRDVTENDFQAKVTEVILSQALRRAVLAKPQLLLRLPFRRARATTEK